PRPGARRHYARRVVLLDDRRTLARRGEIAAGQDGRHDPALARTEVHAARAPDRARAPTDLHALGNARAVAQPLADDAQAYDLDRLVGARPVSVRALVLARERFVDRRARHHGHGQLERLPLVTAVGRALNAKRPRGSRASCSTPRSSGRRRPPRRAASRAARPPAPG